MKLTRLVPLVAAAALFAACSPTAGTALVVDGASYSESDIDRTVQGCADAMGVTPQDIVRPAVVQSLLLGGVFDRLADEYGHLSNETIDEVAAQGEFASMMQSQDCLPLIRASVKTSLLQQVDFEAVQTAARQADVQLNPRYGKWIPEDPALMDVSPSLSVPAGQ
jgi:hypothetical protein